MGLRLRRWVRSWAQRGTADGLKRESSLKLCKPICLAASQRLACSTWRSLGDKNAALQVDFSRGASITVVVSWARSTHLLVLSAAQRFFASAFSKGYLRLHREASAARRTHEREKEREGERGRAKRGVRARAAMAKRAKCSVKKSSEPVYLGRSLQSGRQ